MSQAEDFPPNYVLRTWSHLQDTFIQTTLSLLTNESTTRNGILEYWGAEDYGRPPAGAVKFKFKTDTDLYDLAKAKTRPCSISFSPDGSSMAVTARDKQAGHLFTEYVVEC